MRGYSEEYVLEVVERRDVDQLAALDEGVEERGPTGTLEAAREQPILPTHRDDAELILGSVIVDGQPAILHKALQRRPLIGEIADGVAEGRLGEDRSREILAHGVHLREER